jgi:hypothetical protein
MEYRTLDIAQKIAEVLEDCAPAGCACMLYPNAAPGECVPEPVLYTDGFGFEDKKAKLHVVKETDMFDKLKPTSSLILTVEADLPKPG